jgi:copper(I)-binding protein
VEGVEGNVPARRLPQLTFGAGIFLLALAVWQWDGAGRPLSLSPTRLVVEQATVELPPAAGAGVTAVQFVLENTSLKPVHVVGLASC